MIVRLENVKSSNRLERLSDTLLITGDGKGLPGDLATFLEKAIPHDVMCIGRSIKLYPGRVHHYADIDADNDKWVLENLLKNNPDKGSPLIHTIGVVDWVDECWSIVGCTESLEDCMWHGSTALFAVYVGLEMGYSKIVLAGCPLDSKGHWYFQSETSGPKWTYQGYQAWFEFKGFDDRSCRVSSLSGYTKILLGGDF